MPRALDPNPSPDALRKREARARAKAANPQAYAKTVAEASQAYRDQKKAERAAAAGPAPDTGGAHARKALAECREKVCDEVAEKLADFYSAAVKEAHQAKQAAPALKAAAIESAERARVKIAQAISIDALADRLAEHSRATEKEPIERRTAFDYATRLLFLQKMHTGKEATAINFETFRDIPAIWRTILNGKAASGPNKGQPWSLSSKLVYAGAVSGVLRRLAGFEREHADYSKRYTELHATYDAERKENRMTTDERQKFVPWPQLVARFEKEAKGPTKLTPRELALFGLYVAIPPRRVRDFTEMRVARAGRRDLDKTANWIQLDARGTPVRMVFNVYKTAKRYGQHVRDSLPPALAKVLGDYIRAAGLADGAQLFPATGGSAYTPGAFSALVGGLFQKITGQRASVNILRHSAITHFLDRRHSVAEKEAFAKQMGHSVGMQALYDRVDAESSDDDAPPARATSKAAAAKARPKATPAKAAPKAAAARVPAYAKAAAKAAAKGRARR